MGLVFGTTILTATYDKVTQNIVVSGYAFADTQYAGISNIEVSKTGLGVWIPVSTISSWADTSANGVYVTKLASGRYDARVTSSDGEISNILANAFKVGGETVLSGTMDGQSVRIVNVEKDGHMVYVLFVDSSNNLKASRFTIYQGDNIATNVSVL